MTDFDDLVSAERRGIDAQATADGRRRAAEASEHELWARDEQAAWRAAIDHMNGLFADSLRHLRDARVAPLPTLESRKPRPFQSVDRVVITGHRWQFGSFALDGDGRVYLAAGVTTLIPKHPNDLATDPFIRKQLRKARLRTGLKADDQVIWTGTETLRTPLVLDPAKAVQTGRIHCFGKANDGTPLLLSHDPNGRPEELEPYLARTVARRVEENRRR
ncbi:hypothetical protein [Actinomadura roseirufa]|uniref:hypothetical protein n=1 Tax=Actinomadura roseirufa TaxID=2094049 RepID=UPI0010418B4E|nr:hypothetical protein [Actinomadura roseirufa]